MEENLEKNRKRRLVNAYRNIIKHTSKGYGLGKRKPIRKVLNLVQSYLKSDFAEVQGSKMFLDPEDTFNLSLNGVYGELDTNIMKNNISKGDIVIDVGANIGYYALLFSRLVGEKGKVFAFEPEPRNFELLKKNVQVNNYKNIVLIQKALSDKNEQLDLFISKNMANHKIYQQKNQDANSIKIDAIRLDDYIKNQDLTDKINFIKIDVEGAELRAFNGMKTILKESKTLKVFTEFMYHLLKECGSEPKELVDLLIGGDFKINYVDSEKNEIVPANLEKLTTPKNYKGTVNLFCTKENIS